MAGDLGPAVAAGERAVEIADELGDLQLEIVARSALGPALAARGDHHHATEVLTVAVERLSGDLARDVMGTTGIIAVFSRIYLATSLAELGDFATAMLHAEPAYQIAEAARHIYSIVFACYGIGTIRGIRGDVAGSIAVLEHGLELSRSWNLPVALPLLSTSLGHAYCLAARPEEALVLLEEAERQTGATRRMGARAILMVRLGEAYLQAQRTEDARRCAQLAITLSRQLMERAFEAYALRLLGELGLQDPPDLEDSEAFYRQAAKRAKKLMMRPLLAQCYLDLARLHRRTGRPASAETHLHRALALFRALDMPYWRAQADALLSMPP